MYKRILLAYDGSVEGRTALREGALLARQCGAEVFLLIRPRRSRYIYVDRSSPRWSVCSDGK